MCNSGCVLRCAFVLFTHAFVHITHAHIQSTQLLREAVQKLYPSQALPDVPPPAKTASYGSVALKLGRAILDVAASMSNGGLQVDVPENMEQYNQSYVIDTRKKSCDGKSNLLTGLA